MKLTFHPSKESILGLLGHQLKETQASLDEARKALAETEEKALGSKLYNQYQEQEIKGLKGRVLAWEGEEKKVQDTIGLIETSEGPLTAETEVQA